MPGQSETNQKEGAQLRRCKLCGKEISPYSPFCRNCGHPQGSALALWLLGAFLALLIAFYIAMTLFSLCNVQRFHVYNEPNPRLEQESVGQWLAREAPGPIK